MIYGKYLVFLASLMWLSPLSAQINPVPTIRQKADQSTCSNIVALSGNVDINCSDLTPEQAKLLASIPSILNKILANQIAPSKVLAKLDEILAATKVNRSETQTCYGSNCLQGPNGTMVVNPPAVRAKKGIAYVQQQVRSDDPKYKYEQKITLTAGDEIDSASFELYFDHPYEYHDATFKDGSIPIGSVSRPDNETYHLNLDSVFEPDNPLIVHIYSNERLKCIGVSRFH